jgi:hypothetical protein
MVVYNDELRPCVVNGSRALFHGWAEMEKPNIEDGKQVGRWKNVVAVIEFRSGEVKAVRPNEVRFLDSDKQFAKYDWREDDE